jgi:hypothetical protein
VCAAGLAVLDVLEEEGLQANAARVGALLKHELGLLAADFPTIGDVRGSGLFLGIEFVRTDTQVAESSSSSPPPPPGAPGTAETSFICSHLKEEAHILTSIDGPHDNVLVLKPPMCVEVHPACCLLWPAHTHVVPLLLLLLLLCCALAGSACVRRPPPPPPPPPPTTTTTTTTDAAHAGASRQRTHESS